MLFQGIAAVARDNGLTARSGQPRTTSPTPAWTHDRPGAEEHARLRGRSPQAVGCAGGSDVGREWLVLTMSGRLDEAYQLGLELLQSGGERPGRWR